MITLLGHVFESTILSENFRHSNPPIMAWSEISPKSNLGKDRLAVGEEFSCRTNPFENRRSIYGGDFLKRRMSEGRAKENSSNKLMKLQLLTPKCGIEFDPPFKKS